MPFRNVTDQRDGNKANVQGKEEACSSTALRRFYAFNVLLRLPGSLGTGQTSMAHIIVFSPTALGTQPKPKILTPASTPATADSCALCWNGFFNDRRVNQVSMVTKN